MCNFTTLYVQFVILSWDEAVLTIWLGLGTKVTWLGVEKKYSFWFKIPVLVRVRVRVQISCFTLTDVETQSRSTVTIPSTFQNERVVCWTFVETSIWNIVNDTYGGLQKCLLQTVHSGDWAESVCVIWAINPPSTTESVQPAGLWVCVWTRREQGVCTEHLLYCWYNYSHRLLTSLPSLSFLHPSMALRCWSHLVYLMYR